MQLTTDGTNMSECFKSIFNYDASNQQVWGMTSHATFHPYGPTKGICCSEQGVNDGNFGRAVLDGWIECW